MWRNPAICILRDSGQHKDAVRYWNDTNEYGNRPVLERVGVEPCRDVDEALKDAD